MPGVRDGAAGDRGPGGEAERGDDRAAGQGGTGALRCPRAPRDERAAGREGPGETGEGDQAGRAQQPDGAAEQGGRAQAGQGPVEGEGPQRLRAPRDERPGHPQERAAGQRPRARHGGGAERDREAAAEQEEPERTHASDLVV